VADEHPEGVGPSILHPEQDRNRKDQDEPEQASLFRPKMHEKQYGEPGLDARNREHTPEHLRCVDMLIRNDELETGQGQQANIDDQVLSDSATLMPFRASHRILLQRFLI